MSFLQCARTNPQRPPNWRWLRAVGINGGTQPRPGRRRDGPAGHKWIHKAVRFAQAYNAAVGEEAKARLAAEMPDVFWAHSLYSNESNTMKWDLEAHLLARSSDWEIGFHCGLPTEIVSAYENLFFNVREKLAHRGYVIHCVMGPSVHRGLSEREFDLLWKMYGYAYGPHMLKSLVAKFENPVWCGSPESVSSAIQDDTVSTMKMKASLAAKTIPVNMGTQVDILHIFTKYVEIERMSDTAGKAQDQILDHIGAMFNVLPLNVAGLDPHNNHEKISKGPVQRFEETAIELSFEETMSVGTGGQLANAGTLSQLQFPPVPTEEEAGGSAK